MTRRRYPLWFLLAGGPCLLLAVAALSIGLISYWQAQHSLNSVSERVRQAALERITLHLGSLFERLEAANQVTVNIAKAGLLDTRDIDGWFPFLFRAAQLEPDTSNIALATAAAEYLGIDKTASGELFRQRAGSASAATLVVSRVAADAAVGEVTSRSPGYDPRARPWYRLAAEKKAPAWSAVYAHYAEPTLQIAHSIPVMDGTGQVAGVFVRATRLAYLSQYLRQLELLAQASAFVMERDGSLVAWTREEPVFSVEGTARKVRRRNILELSEFAAPAEHQALAALLQTSAMPRGGLARELTIAGEGHYLDVRPYVNVNGIDWWVVTLFPKSAFAKEVEEGLSAALSLSALIVLAALGLVLLFARRVLGAIGQLKAATDALATGTQVAAPAPSKVVELDDLATNFTRMAQQIEERTSALEAAVRENRALLDNAVVGICYMRERVIMSCNRQMETLFGYQQGELLGQSTAVLYSSREAFEEIGRYASEVLAHEGICRAEVQLRHRSGRLFWGSLEGRLIDPGNLRGGRVWIFSDISERKSAEEKLLLWAKVFESSGEGIVITDASTRIVAVNQAFCEITGYSQNDALGHTPRILGSGRHDSSFFQAMWHALAERGQWRGELWNRRRGGDIYPAWLTVSAVSAASGEITHYVGVFSDISPLKKSQERLDFLAHHDVLTGLPNRVLFNDRLVQAVARAKRDNRQLGVLFIDLDGFKDINDTLGHHMGDELLKCVAQQLTATMRASDTIARLGGDEFILLLEDIDGIHGASAFTTKLLAIFGRTFHLAGHDIHVTASIGISIFPDDGDDPNVLIRNADAAMYQAKAHGRNACYFYSPEMTALAEDRLRLAAMLRKAVENDEIVLHFQPQFDLDTGQVTGAEALMRWSHPALGLVPPARFIALAEQIGVIGQLGEFVLRRACEQIGQWRLAGLALPRIAVNVSAKQVERGDFVDLVAAVLGQTGLDAASLELEITESAILETEKVMGLVHGLRGLGVSLSIDDFGTGYSSLSYLRNMPIQRLKIDRSFVADASPGSSNESIVRAIIALAKSLGLAVVAEGVESAAQEALLRREGCDEVQGYLYGKPVPADEFFATWHGACVAPSRREVNS